MNVADSYRAPNPEAAVEIIAANPWAVLVSCTDEAPLASSTFEAAEPERAIFETEARDYWARIGPGAGVINFDSIRFAAHEIPPDKARREVAGR
jgi:hypothetical protein